MTTVARFLLGHRKSAVTSDKLWGVVILVCIVILTSLVPQTPNDFWWHLKIGEWIFQKGGIPNTSMYSWSIAADTPFVYGAWLGEFLMYLLFRFGDIPLVMFFRTILLAVTAYLVMYQTWLRMKSWRLAALAAGLAFFMSFNNIIVRPQMWSWLPFMVFLIVLQAYKTRRISYHWLIVCPLVMIFWVNAHGAYILGIILCGAYAVGESARHVLNQRDALGCPNIRWLWLTLILVVLATILNPQGIGIFKYVYTLMTDQSSQKLIVEWQTPEPEGLPNMVFYGSILLTIIVMWFSKRKPDLTDMVLVLGFTWLAWTGMRYVIWYGLAVMPILFDYASDLIPDRFLSAAAQRNMFNNIIAVIMLTPCLLTLPWWVSSVTSLMPETYRELLAVNDDYGPMQSVSTPVAVVEYLKAHPVDNVYNEMGYGSFFIWALPEQRVFVDPRVELYPYELWLDYIRISKGTRYSYLLDEYEVNRVVLDLDNMEELAESLELDEEWDRVYEDTRTVVWDRVDY